MHIHIKHTYLKQINNFIIPMNHCVSVLLYPIHFILAYALSCDYTIKSENTNAYVNYLLIILIWEIQFAGISHPLFSAGLVYCAIIYVVS